MAGEVINRPNTFQRFILRFAVLRPVTAFFSSWIYRVDNAVLALTGGKHTASEIIGWNIIQLTTVGAKTAQPRIIPLVALFDGEKIALIASRFGHEHNPGWYYNLKANPICLVQWKGQSKTFIARETSGDEYERYWRLGVSYYAGYEKYKARAVRHIPVMVLEPKM